MKYKVAGLSMEFSDLNFKNIDNFDFRAKGSVLSYDILIVNLNGINAEYRYEQELVNTAYKQFQGKPLLRGKDSYQLIADIKRRKKEIVEFIESGKTIILIPPEDHQVAVQTSKRKLVDLFDIIPIEDIYFTAGSGVEIEYNSIEPYTSFFEIKDIQYEYYYSIETIEKKAHDLAFLSNSKRIVAKDLIIDSAHLVILPVNLKRKDYSNDTTYRKIVNKFLNVLDEFHAETQYSIEDFELPQWTYSYPILEEKEIKDSIDNIEEEIKNLTSKKEKLNNELEAIQKYKLLLTSTGEELEKSVTRIFEELGFESKSREHNRVDRIFEYGSNEFVVEIKGVNKSAKEAHAAQLEKWVSEYIIEKNKKPKPILVVNAWRKQELSKRTEQSFPNQMVEYATNRRQCLLSTTQLLCLFLDIKKNPKKKDALLKEMFETNGIYCKYENPNAFLKQ